MPQPFDITVKNYRGFADFSPAKVRMSSGFSAIVGPNNAGKSSFLKLFFELRDLFSQFATPGFIFQGLGRNPWNAPLGNVPDPYALLCDFTKRPCTISISFPYGSDVARITELVIEARDTGFRNWTFTLKGPEGDITQHDGHENVFVPFRGNPQPVSLAPITEIGAWLARSMYVGPFRNAVNAGAGAHFDLQIGTGFVALFHEMKTGKSREHQQQIRRVIRDLEHIFGYRRLEINASRELDTLVVEVDERPYGLNDMGSGFAEFLVLFVNAAARKPSFLLIDEPELHLHPALQSDFLTSLTSYTSSESVLFATHSLGLARTVGDHIFAFQREDERIRVQPFDQTAGFAEFLGEMSFAGYRELGFKTVLLVEGRTDVKAVQQILRMLDKDHSVIVLPLGGSAMITDSAESEMAELLRLGAEVFVLVDSEREAADAPLSRERADFLTMCARLGFQAHATERRALENYLTDAAIKAVKGQKYSALAPFATLGARDWAKPENWRIVREMRWEDLENTDVGLFLSRLP
jgi:predicted ATPase